MLIKCDVSLCDRAELGDKFFLKNGFLLGKDTRTRRFVYPQYRHFQIGECFTVERAHAIVG